MCGLAGIAGYDGSRAAARTATAAMCGRLAARGPDGSGLWEGDGAVLGHRRLAVIDLDTGSQPMTDDAGLLALAVNGEIYNYRELRARLQELGHTFISASDSEVALHGFEEYGEELFARLDGMFAIALYDGRRRRLWLARDPFGQKPLVWFRSGGELVFASTLHALKAHPKFPHGRYRAEGAADFLSYWYVPGPETIYEGVFKVPPGHWMRFDLDAGAIETRRYFELDFQAKIDAKPAELVERTRYLFERSVRKRLVSDVPLGAFLSGGMDSLLVAGTMLRLRREPLDIYSIGFDRAEYDELDGVHASLEYFKTLGLEHWRAHEKSVSPDDFELLLELWRDYGEPFGDASVLPTGLLCRFARQTLTVALSGDGADEFFGGYERYLAMSFYRKIDWLPEALRRPVAGALTLLLPSRGERSVTGKVKRLFELGRFNALERYYHLMNKAESAEKLRVAGPRLRAAVADGEGRDRSMDYLLGALGRIAVRDPGERYAAADIATYLANDILPKVDTASMSTALEVRAPFLDRDLARWSAGLPWHFKQNGVSRKDILKLAFADWLPPEIARRPKKGFGVPVADYLGGVWRPELKRQLLNGALARDGWVEKDRVKELLERRDQAGVNLQWGLLCLGAFLESDNEPV